MGRKRKLTSDLINAVMHNQSNQVFALVMKGADPNGCEDELLFSPLHYAAAHSNAEVISLLLNAGSNLSAKDFDGHTPMDNARLYDNRDFIELCLG